MTLLDWFEKGASAQDYIESMEVNKETLLHIYNHYIPSEDAVQKMERLQGKGMKAVVLTADWCGDAMVNVPIFLKLAQTALMDVRFLIRDENLELMDQYLTNGRARSIPIIVFFDREGKEAGKWGPRAGEIEARVTEWKKQLPDPETDAYKEAFKTELIPKTRKLFQQKETWDKIEADLLQTMSQL
ncbi:thioredoxin family protein [Shouchella clausii]|uniref:Thioredoxin family protein n=1 Tax=Shouchella clausii TaxID=79880 RepID=A0A268RUH2_SHOCL|nr:thioredoxin family protein [Shouchella clausii]PAD41005.1 thioredoxin family protein [Bacillus sp. 7520-S]PAF23908.1 thioredoxin family protein [Shouchella clausii]